jgi:hypothetical protein
MAYTGDVRTCYLQCNLTRTTVQDVRRISQRTRDVLCYKQRALHYNELKRKGYFKDKYSCLSERHEGIGGGWMCEFSRR